MKKSLILVGLLSIGYAYAQEERVGINTETPSATFNVKTKNDKNSPKNLELENQLGTKLVTVLNNGKVGVGIETPKEQLHVMGGIRTQGSGKVGGYLDIVNSSKTGTGNEAKAGMWRLYNMTDSYVNGLHFWAYPEDTPSKPIVAPAMVLTDTGNLGIGTTGQSAPTERLHIAKGNVRINTLFMHKGSEADKIVVVDTDGVLKSIDRNSIGSSNSINEDEWAYEDSTKRVNLKRGGTQAMANSHIFYNQNGAYINSNMLNETTSYFDINTSTIQQGAVTEYDKLANNLLLKKITSDTYLPLDSRGRYSLTLNESYMYVEDTKNDGKEIDLLGQSSFVSIAPSNTRNYLQLRGARASSSHAGTGNAKYIIGTYSDARIDRGTSDGYVFGGRFTASYATNQSSKNQTGVQIYNQVLKSGGGKITTMSGAGIFTTIANDNPLTVTNINGLNIENAFPKVANLTVTDAVGINYQGIDTSTKQNLIFTNNYGIKLGDIKGATTANYAIHTGAGQVRLGDLKGVGDRAVYVDADGVLKAGAAGTGLRTTGLWKREGSEVKLAVLSDGTDRTQENTVAINDKGEIYATSLKGKNGASIFPDYVFQKYYTGTSSIKADYTFKSLSQVEDFVKTNGHLPGYKSAEVIKAQGYIDVMETQVANVEKIEELYLHTIEQEKALKEKDAKIKSLEERLERLEKLIK